MTLNKKQELGQFFTKGDSWLKPQVIDFIKESNKKKAFDPFAGGGDLLKLVKEKGLVEETKGVDIDKSLGWEYSDSLKEIKKTDSIIITNPPYLAKNSAKRNSLSTYKYFKNNTYEDLYLIAIENALKTHDYVVAIIPETFLLKRYFLDRVNSITVLEETPFEDTDFPVCVVCFGKEKTSDFPIYKNSSYKIHYLSLLKKTKIPNKTIEMNFNKKNGQIGLRAIDSTKETNIEFCLPRELNYNLDKIGNSSRSITVIEVKTKHKDKDIIKKSNEILKKYREETGDLLLASFKGNKKNGERRRRLDYRTARAILEEAIESLSK